MRLLLNEQGFNGQPCYLGAAGFHRLVVTCLGQTIPVTPEETEISRTRQSVILKVLKNTVSPTANL